MPIYEFYCRDCHVVLNFFSGRIAPDAKPACPRCGRAELPRKPSSFAMLKRGAAGDAAGDEDDPLAGIDEARLEGAMESILRESDGLDENDPRAMGRLMRRFSELAGVELGEQMEDYVARLARGEDPEALGAEMDGAMGEEEMFRLREAARRRKAPRVDGELYFL